MALFRPMATTEKTIKTQLPTKYLAVFTEYSADYSVDLKHLMEEQSHAQLVCMQDSAFAALNELDDRAAKQDPADPLTDVSLDFCDQVYELIVCVAKLLRRDESDLVSGLLQSASATLSSYIEEGKTKPNDEWFHSQMPDWAKAAIDFHQCAKRNATPKTCGVDSWDYMQLDRSKAREVA